MRVIVCSDSHGNYSNLKKIVENNLSADMFIHLGDGEKELDIIVTLYPEKHFIHIKGNCDIGSFSSIAQTIPLDENNKIFATHGHNYAVNYSIEAIKKAASEKHANIVIFGHTHSRFQTYEDGIYFLNPGSCSSPRDGNPPSYGFIDITKAGIVTNIVDIK